MKPFSYKAYFMNLHNTRNPHIVLNILKYLCQIRSVHKILLKQLKVSILHKYYYQTFRRQKVLNKTHTMQEKERRIKT